MAYRIVLRRDTSTNWTTNNPVLLLGEPGFETNTSRMKIGDGSTLWNDLPYYVGYDLLALDSDLIPATGGTYDLGATSGYSWRDLYLSGNTIYLGDATLSAVGSSVSMDTIILGGPTADGGVSLSATGGYLTSDGSLLNGDRLVNGDLEVILDSSGTLNTPLLLPISFTAICDESHMIDPVVFEGTGWWEFQVEFQVSPYGSIAVMIDNIFPILTNPGYESGYTFRFTEEDHGIPNYNFDIELNDVVQPGPAGWTSNIAVSQAPEYPSTIESLGAIKITSNSNSIILATDGVLSIPDSIEFPFLDGNNRTGNGNNLQFEKGSAVQKIISTQDGTELVPTVERLVISGGDSYFDGSEYLGEGGDIYLWAGQGENGGDIKVDGGESTTGQGGTVKIRGGYSSESFGGFVEIWSGAGALGGGDISITAQNGGTAAQSGGEIYLETIGNTANTWIFKNDGNLTLPVGGDILDSNGNSVIGGLIDCTYSEIQSDISNNQLIPGSYYRITDFRTCYDQPNYDYLGDPITEGNYKEGSVSPIIVFAISSDSLASDAYQPEFPNDNIKYDVTFNQTEVTDGPAFGRIVYRKDDQGNAFDYDFREVLFKRYDAYFSENVYDGTVSITAGGTGEGIVTGVGTFFTNFSTGEIIGVLNVNSDPIVNYYEIVSIEDDTNMVVAGKVISESSEVRLVDSNLLEGMSWKQNNIPSNTASVELPTFGDINECFNNTSTNTAAYTLWNENTFLLPNNVFKGDSVYRENSFANNFRNNTFNTSCDSNRVVGSFYNNIFDNDFDNNIINDNFYDNIIDCDFQFNVINGEFYNNHFGDEDGEDFDYNTINGEFYNNFYTGENDFEYNIINGGFDNNIILNGFSKNTLKGFYSNVLEDTFSDNQIGEDFSGNKTYAEFRENTIADDVYNNNFFGTFNNNVIAGDEVYENNFYSYAEDNQIGANFQLNTIGDPENIGNTNFTKNYIGTDVKGNLISGYFEGNKIGHLFVANQIGDNFNDNNIGNYFIENDILDGFSDNFILNTFAGNNIANGFRGNKIGNYFINNTIGDDFGYGGSNWRGNVIGNNFIDNTIGEYFYDNNVGDNFGNNTIGNYFEWNTIDTRIESTDFTINYGNITGFTYTSGGTGGATDGTYPGLTGFVSGGPGSGAAFDVGVSGGTVYSVALNTAGSQYTTNDTITILGTAIGGITGGIQTFTSNAIGKTGADDTYIGLIAGATAGGENASFTVTVTSSLVSDIQIYDKGVAYSVGDNLTILGSQFGGTDGSDDISISVSTLYSDSIVIGITGISQTPSVYEEYTCQIFERKGGNKRLSFYDENDILTIKNINE
jgi:hypothetical protein